MSGAPSARRVDAEAIASPGPVLDPAIERRPRGHAWVTASALVLAILAVAVLVQIAVNPNLQWPVILEFLWDPRILSGLGLTVGVTAGAMVIAVVFGFLLANARLSSSAILRWIAWAYTWFFRSVPTLVLMLIVYNIALLFPRIVVGVPGVFELAALRTQDLVNGLVTGICVFGFQQAAYTAEVFRSALLSIPNGQRDAAASIGLTPRKAMLLVLLPQALRVAFPPTMNDTINLMKSTSLLAFIAVADLLYSAQQIYSQNYKIIPLLMVVCFWYVVLVSALSLLQHLLERRLGSVRQGTTARSEGGRG